MSSISWWALLVSQSLVITVCIAADEKGSVVYPTSNSTPHSLPVFPDPVVRFVGSTRLIAPPVNNLGRPLCVSEPDDTFCEKVENYPRNYIRKVINYTQEEFKELFGTMSVNARRMTPGDLSEESVCPQQSRMFYPKAAENENEQWAYVVNDVDYVQAVMAEMCDNEDGPCNYLNGVLPSGVSSRCRQKYAYKRLLALHPSNKKTYTDAFRFPSCCVCFVTQPFILSRARQGKENPEDQGVTTTPSY